MIKLLLVVVLCISSMQVFSESNDGFSTKCLTDFSSEKYKEALSSCAIAAEQSNAYAQHVLGFIYYSGQGTTQDYKQAFKWFKRAAEQGVADAQYNLALMHNNGQGTTQDYKQAFKWYTFAAEQGVADAQNNLGFMYDNGFGVLQDNIYAHMWLNVASSNGSIKAPENRNIVAERMTKKQIEKAQKLARECVAKKYKNC